MVRIVLIYSIQFLLSIWVILATRRISTRFHFAARIGVITLAVADAFYFMFVYVLNTGTSSELVFYLTSIPYACSFISFTIAIGYLVKGKIRFQKAPVEALTLVTVLALFAKFFFLPLIDKVVAQGFTFAVLSHGGTIVSSVPLIIFSYVLVVFSKTTPSGIFASSLILLGLLDWSIQLATIINGDLYFSSYDVLWCLGVICLCLSLRQINPERDFEILTESSLLRLVKASIVLLFLAVVVSVTGAIEGKTIEKALVVNSLGFFVSCFVGLMVALRIRKSFEKLNETIANSIGSHQENRGIIDGTTFVQGVPIEVADTIRHVINCAHEIERKRLAEEASIITKMAQQVSHDVRSPLSALNMVVSSLKELPEEKRLIIRNAVSRINDIANLLLQKSKSTKELPKADMVSSASTMPWEPIMIVAILDSIISEKRVQFREKMNVEIQGELLGGYGLFAMIDGTEFGRVISNLVNNSVEAFEESGQVSIRLRADQEHAIITVQDNGKGIPPHFLTRLGERGVSFGKKGTQSGSGLGVHHARSAIESVGGSLRIDSTVGKGTTVTIELRLAKPPSWFLESLRLGEEMTVVSIDDDQTIHQIWSGRIKSSDLAGKVEHLTFTSIQVFERWLQSSKNDNITFLIDYEFLNQSGNGLDVIERCGIAAQAVLVTSRYDERHVREKAASLGVRILPKGLAPFVPLIIEKLLEKHDAG